MRLTASHLVDWVNTHGKEAQTNLPRWIRRLCFDPEATRQLSFPAGDSTFIPGWDGVLSSERGNTWVPVGPSRWEIGCDQDVSGKANKEYLKRTAQTIAETRLASTFVFVTPRRWTTKAVWTNTQGAKGQWADVRVYDADDLEQWLEQSPAVALAFAEELGLSGEGVVSLSNYWNNWSRQCESVITPNAFFMGRGATHDALKDKILAAVANLTSHHFLTTRAESVEEAAAFAVAVVMASGGLQDQALVVVEPQGWRYVDANPQLKITIAARTEIAARPALRNGLLVIVPHATGDLAAKPKGDELILERPSIYEFKKALLAIGMEESDATRYALSTGRSWTVLRRQLARNPAVRTPAWLDAQQSASLALLCLLGTWNADKEADRQVVARLAARPYEDIEQDFHDLACLDDAPILRIGAVWKAKSPLELLGLCGGRITRGLLDRFFTIAREMLTASDPQLELPEEERWMAQVHGKVHPYSGLLFDSVCDSLMKLAVRGPDEPGLLTLNVENRVAGLVVELLDEADGVRWLSLASYLPTLAEAAPNAFIHAVEKSLRLPDAPVARLITETSSTGIGGRCWHAGLLWALETLAWGPNRLARVAQILAQLSHIPIKGNWANTPGASLFGLFRSWLPQTAASLPERIKVLELLILKDEEAAFAVLERLATGGPQMANHAARPKWRDDDAGAGKGIPQAEMWEMLDFAREKLLQLSKGNARRIAALLTNTVLRQREGLPIILPLMEPFTQTAAEDESRELLRRALRKIIHWHRNYDEAPPAELNAWLCPVEACYERLAPQDLLIRHRWLFDNHWLELPSRDVKDIQKRTDAIALVRAAALTEIFEAQGLSGIEALIAICAEPGVIGGTLAGISWAGVSWADWIANKGEDFASGKPMTWCVSGFLWATPAAGEFLEKVTTCGEIAGWDPAQLAGLLVLAPAGVGVWQLADASGPEVVEAYWRNVRPSPWNTEADLEFVLTRLLAARRPRTALHYCQYSLENTPVHLLFSALQKYSLGEEANGPPIDSWHLAEMLERLEKSGEIEKMKLIQLEFGLFPALGYGQEARAGALYKGIMTEPALFAELIRYVYKPAHNDREVPVTDESRMAADCSWHILHACRQQPGIQPDGSTDKDAFFRFVQDVRELCRQSDRLAPGDVTLGQILAHCPADEDGTWPFGPARNLLDQAEMEDVRSGFRTGARNKRGVTCRSPCDGGGQERELASYYRDQAERVQHSHPNVAAMLEDIAKSYEHDGKREDIEANLRKEAY